MPEWCYLVCRLMIVLLPASLAAQDPTRGLLYSSGGTWLNEVPAPSVAAVFPDSLVQTQAGHAARIEVQGSSILIQPETMLQFQGHELVVDHGSLQLDTSLEMEVIVGCITISPVTYDRTQLDLTDIGGKARISVSKGDVKIHSHGMAVRKSKADSDTILHPGDHAVRADACGSTSAPNTANDGWLNSRTAQITGGVIAGTLICLGVCHGDDPVSPAKP
ncbi:MAG: hypothetical protein WA824_09195 [Candidatus Sulfotelmatobacter sp.]